MLPDQLVTITEACNLPPADPDSPVTKDRLRKALEDGVLEGARQDATGRRSWRIPVGDLVNEGFVSTAVYGAAGADPSHLEQKVEQLNTKLAEAREELRVHGTILLQMQAAVMQLKDRA